MVLVSVGELTGVQGTGNVAGRVVSGVQDGQAYEECGGYNSGAKGMIGTGVSRKKRMK